jgi:hypothetical protein
VIFTLVALSDQADVLSARHSIHITSALSGSSVNSYDFPGAILPRGGRLAY